MYFVNIGCCIMFIYYFLFWIYLEYWITSERAIECGYISNKFYVWINFCIIWQGCDSTKRIYISQWFSKLFLAWFCVLSFCTQKKYKIVSYTYLPKLPDGTKTFFDTAIETLSQEQEFCFLIIFCIDWFYKPFVSFIMVNEHYLRTFCSIYMNSSIIRI